MATSTALDANLSRPTTRSAVRHLVTAGRILLGLTFFVLGLDGFFHFMPQPAPESLSPGVLAFSGALMNTGYFFPLLKGVEVLSGALLLSNRFVPLALTLLAPIVVNIVAFHLFLDPSGLIIAIVILLLEIALAWAYRDAYRPMLAARVTPGRK